MGRGGWFECDMSECTCAWSLWWPASETRALAVGMLSAHPRSWPSAAADYHMPSALPPTRLLHPPPTRRAQRPRAAGAARGAARRCGQRGAAAPQRVHRRAALPARGVCPSGAPRPTAGARCGNTAVLCCCWLVCFFTRPATGLCCYSLLGWGGGSRALALAAAVARGLEGRCAGSCANVAGVCLKPSMQLSPGHACTLPAPGR